MSCLKLYLSHVPLLVFLSWFDSPNGPTLPCFQGFVMTLLGMDYMGLLFMLVARVFNSSF